MTRTSSSRSRSSGQRARQAAPELRRAFVTGGAGFIGSHVVRALLDRGVEVRCLVEPGDHAPLLAGLPVHRVQGDVLRAEHLDEAMAGCDHVFHLAALFALWHPEPHRIYAVNVEGTRRVLDAAERAGVSRIVHTSSIAAVGYRPGQEPADEGDAFNQWDVANPYVLSKYISELEARSRSSDRPEVVTVNPSMPFGPYDLGPTPTGRLVLDTLRGKLPFYVEGGVNAVDVRDVAEGHVLAAEHGRGGERYILGGDNVTHRDFMERIARLAERRPPRVRVPASVLQGVGGVAEMLADHVTRRAPLMTRSSVAYIAERYLWFDLDKARRELGYEHRSLDETLEDAVAWFRYHWESPAA